MAKQPSITTVSSGFLSRDQINTNFTTIRDAFDNTLSLDGSTPNTISANVDWNGYDILNLNGLSAVGGGVVDLADLTAVGAITADVTTVAGIAADVTTVSGIFADVTTVAGVAPQVVIVSGVSADVTTLAPISTNITTVAGVASSVPTVAGISADVTTVAGISADVTTVAGISADVTAAATNSVDISNFANVYRISASEPITSLDAGDLYFNTATSTLSMYTGSAWQAATIGALVNVVEDLTPQLGGNLEMNGNTIVDITLTGAIVEDVFALSGTSVALDPSNGTIQTHTLSGTTTYTDSLSTGESITLVIPGTANTITWPTIKWLGGVAPTLDATNDNIITVFKVGSTLYGSNLGVFS